MIKKYKIPLIAALAVLTAVCLVFGGIKLVETGKYKEAQGLYELGSYTEAREIFLELERFEEAEDCVYQATLLKLKAAEAMMEEGRLEEAEAQLTALGDFENAPELVLECEYRKAKKLNEEGSFSEALKIAEKISEHPQVEELLDETQELLYGQALQLAYACDMDGAMELLVKLGDYKDSQTLYRRCLERRALMESGGAEPVRYPGYSGMELAGGTLYWHRVGHVYVPRECNAETRAMIFYPGGYETSLSNGYVTEYLYGTYGELPNAIMVFCHANGYFDMLSKAEDAYNVLEQAAMENDVFLHDIALIGASMGAYTAAHTAVWLFEEQGIRANYVLTLDAGGHWASSVPILTTDECDLAAKAGTEFYLVEGDGVGMNILAIQTMVAHGMDVTIAHVRDYGHYSVIYDAMEYGVFNWVMGDGERPEHDNYTYIPLDKNSTYPN